MIDHIELAITRGGRRLHIVKPLPDLTDYNGVMAIGGCLKPLLLMMLMELAGTMTEKRRTYRPDEEKNWGPNIRDEANSRPWQAETRTVYEEGQL